MYCILFSCLDFKGYKNTHKITKKITKRTVGAIKIHAVNLFQILSYPYGKAVFVRISDEYAANILRTALFTVIVRYIFTSCREYPANKIGLTKK